MKTSRLYVVSPPREIFDMLHPAVRARVTLLPDFLRYPEGKFKRLTRSLLVGRLPLPKRVLYGWFPRMYLDILADAPEGDAILLYECSNVRILRAIRPYLPAGVACHIYYCNPVHTLFSDPVRQIGAIRCMGYLPSSFDPRDAETYGMEYTGQYFCEPPVKGEGIYSDCFFCGLPKNRTDRLRKLRYELESRQLKCDFLVPLQLGDTITYSEYLRRLSCSRCVVDITQQNQAGLTRRPLEALFYRKKLITDNCEIKRYDFYNPENIFIFGVDSTDRLKTFVKTPFREVPEEVKEHYDVNGWIRNYLP